MCSSSPAVLCLAAADSGTESSSSHYQAPEGAERFSNVGIGHCHRCCRIDSSWVWAAFNGLVKRRNRTKEAWSQIDVELKRRHDLVPSLVSTVHGYAADEQGTFEAVTEARSNAVSAGSSGDPGQIASAENALSGALRSLFAVAENYPQFRAVESFLQLQEALTSTEDKIEYARRYYNTSARDYNIGLQTFPRNVIATLFHFESVTFFEANGEERSAPSSVSRALDYAQPSRRNLKLLPPTRRVRRR